MPTLRAEVETHISAFTPNNIAIESEMRTGLTDMFASGTPLSAMSVQPYVHFSPGVWIGFDQEVGGCGATVGFRSLRSFTPGVDLEQVSRLSINPVFPMVGRPRWVTLESSVEIEALRAAKSLRLDIISFFEIAPNNITEIPRNITITLRLRRRDGTQSDLLGYRVPVSTMPFEHSMNVAESGMMALNLPDAIEATLLIELPLAGDFTLNLDHFSLRSVGA